MTTDQRPATEPPEHDQGSEQTVGRIHSPRRRAALIASAIALPVTVVLAFLFSSGGSGKTNTTPDAAVVAIAPPPAPTAATRAACARVFAKLPVQLSGLAPRRTDSDSSFVAAWGNPPIVIRCGVARPTVFGTADAAQLVEVNRVLWQPDPQKSQVVYTAVDRSVYIEVTVPANQDQPLPDLAPAVSALPPLCTGTDASGQSGNSALPICR